MRREAGGQRTSYSADRPQFQTHPPGNEEAPRSAGLLGRGPRRAAYCGAPHWKAVVTVTRMARPFTRAGR
jgi:hypothetical protein